MANGGYLPAHAHFLLDQACVAIGWAFDAPPYLVGSALQRPDYRDVDVRVILDDDRYAAMFPGPGHQRAHPFWSLLSSSISLQLQQMTGLPVDFQVQAMTPANEHHHGPRDPLGIFPTAPDDPTPTTGGLIDPDLWPEGCRCSLREDIDWGEIFVPPPGGCPVHSPAKPLGEG